MPAGKTHDRINLVFLLTFLVGMTFVGFISLKYALFFAFGYLFSTYFFGPDLDTKSKLTRRWGLLQFIWRPYRKWFHHRSFFTHGMVIGDIFRIIYLSIWLVPLYVIPAQINYEVGKKTAIPEDMEILLLPISAFLALGIFFSKPYFTKFFRVIEKNKIGTCFSLLYFLAIFSNVFFETSTLQLLKEHYVARPYDFYFSLLGVFLASAVHTMSDILTSSLKGFLK